MIGELYLALWGGWFLYWVISAFGNKRTARRANPIWRIGGLIVAVLVWSDLHGHRSFLRGRLLPPSETRAIVGLVLTAAGLGFAIWARVALGANWSGVPEVKEGHELVQTGPYALVRHPIYTGLLLATFAGCMAEGTWNSLCILIMVTILLVSRIPVEDGFMQELFPESYPAYRRRTKALIPFVL